jgi:membrane protease YdiL (CAAX protease family)
MNIVIVLAVAASAIAMLWAVQSAALAFVGEPLAWPLRFTTRRPLVKYASRMMIHMSWLIIIVGTPLALSINPLDALRQAFPTPAPWRDIAIAFSLMFFPQWIAFWLMIKAGLARFSPQHDEKTRRAKLFRRLLGPIPLAALEEAVFRGVLLEQLLRSFPASTAYTALAIVLSSAGFSSVHFIKKSREQGKAVWQRAYGLFIIGCLLGLAYVVGGRSLWLPISIHAAAVYVIEIMRLYVVFTGPPWLVGQPEFPQSGLIGSLYVLGVAIALVALI